MGIGPFLFGIGHESNEVLSQLQKHLGKEFAKRLKRSCTLRLSFPSFAFAQVFVQKISTFAS